MTRLGLDPSFYGHEAHSLTPPSPPLRQYKKRSGGIQSHLAAAVFWGAPHPHVESPGSRNSSSSVFSTMALRLGPTSSCPRASPLHNLRVLLLLGLILVALAPLTVGKPTDRDPYLELRCRCTNTVSGIPLKSISHMNVLRPGVHCADVEVIATLKTGEQRCLDPNAPLVRRIVKKILEGY